MVFIPSVIKNDKCFSDSPTKIGLIILRLLNKNLGFGLPKP